MKPILIFTLKVICSTLGVFELWIRLIVVLILWDKKPLDNILLDLIWKKGETNE